MRILRRSVAILLSAAMVLCAMPAAVFAAPSQGGWTVSYDAESYGAGKLKVEIFNAGEQYAPLVNWTDGSGTLTADKSSSALFSGDGNYYAVVQYEEEPSYSTGNSGLTDAEIEEEYALYYAARFATTVPDHEFAIATVPGNELTFTQIFGDYQFIYADEAFRAAYNEEAYSPLRDPDVISQEYAALETAPEDSLSYDEDDLFTEAYDAVVEYIDFYELDSYLSTSIDSKRSIIEMLIEYPQSAPEGYTPPESGGQSSGSQGFVKVVAHKLTSSEISSGLTVGSGFFDNCAQLSVTPKQISAGQSYQGMTYGEPGYADVLLYFRDGETTVPAFIETPYSDPYGYGDPDDEEEDDDIFGDLFSSEPESEVLTAEIAFDKDIYVQQGSYTLVSSYNAEKNESDTAACIDWENVSVGANGASVNFNSGRSLVTVDAAVSGLTTGNGLSGLTVNVSGGSAGSVPLSADLCASDSSSAMSGSMSYTLRSLKLKPSDYDSIGFAVEKGVTSGNNMQSVTLSWNKSISGLTSGASYTLPSIDSSAASYTKTLTVQDADGGTGPFTSGETLDAMLSLSIDGYDLVSAFAFILDMSSIMSGSPNYQAAFMKYSAAYSNGASVVSDSVSPFFSFSAPSESKTLTATAAVKLDGLIDLSLSASASVPVGADADLPPEVPAGFALQSSNLNSIVFTWTANTDEDLAGYRLYRKDGSTGNDILMASPEASATSATVPVDLDAWGEAPWYFSLSAVDAGGNESAQCTSVSVTDPRIRFYGSGSWEVTTGTLDDGNIVLAAGNAGALRVAFTPAQAVEEADKPDAVTAVINYKNLAGQQTGSTLTLAKSASYAGSFSIPSDCAVLTGIEYSYVLDGTTLQLGATDINGGDIIAAVSITLPSASEYEPAAMIDSSSIVNGAELIALQGSGSAYTASLARKKYSSATLQLMIGGSAFTNMALSSLAASGDSFTVTAADLPGYVVLELSSIYQAGQIYAEAGFLGSGGSWNAADPFYDSVNDADTARELWFRIPDTGAEGGKLRFSLDAMLGDYSVTLTDGARYAAEEGVSFSSGEHIRMTCELRPAQLSEYMFIDVACGADLSGEPLDNMYLVMTDAQGNQTTVRRYFTGEVDTSALTEGASYSVSLPDNYKGFASEPLTVTVIKDGSNFDSAPRLVLRELTQIEFYAMFETDALGVPGKTVASSQPIVPSGLEIYYKNKQTGEWTLLEGTWSNNTPGRTSGTGYLGTVNIAVKLVSEYIDRRLVDTTAGLKLVFGVSARTVGSSGGAVPFPVQKDAVALCSGQVFYTGSGGTNAAGFSASGLSSTVLDRSATAFYDTSYFTTTPFSWYVGSYDDEGEYPATITGLKAAETPRAEITYTRRYEGGGIVYMVRDRASGSVTRYSDILGSGSDRATATTAFDGLAYGSYDILAYLTDANFSAQTALEERFAMGGLTRVPETVCGTVLENVSFTESSALAAYNMPAEAVDMAQAGIQSVSVAADKDVALEGDRINYSVHLSCAPGGTEAQRTINLTSYGSRLVADSLSVSFATADGQTVAAIVSEITTTNVASVGTSTVAKVTLPESDQLISGTIIVSGKPNNDTGSSHAILRAYIEGHDAGWDYWAGYCRIGDIAVFLPESTKSGKLAGSGRGASDSTLRFVMTSVSSPAATSTHNVTVSKYGYWKDELTLPVVSASKADSFTISAYNAGGTEVWSGSAVFEPADVLPKTVTIKYMSCDIKVEVVAEPGSNKDFAALSSTIMTYGGDYVNTNVAVEIEFDDSNPDAWGLTDARRIMNPALTVKPKRVSTPYVFAFNAVDNLTFDLTASELDLELQGLSYSTKYRAAYPAGLIGSIGVLYDLKTCQEDYEAPGQGVGMDYNRYMTEVLGLSASDAQKNAEALKGLRTFAAGQEDGVYSRTVTEGGVTNGVAFGGIKMSEMPGVPEDPAADEIYCIPAFTESDNIGFELGVSVEVETLNEEALAAKISECREEGPEYTMTFESGSFVRYADESAYVQVRFEEVDGVWRSYLDIVSVRTTIYDVSQLPDTTRRAASAQGGALAKGAPAAGNNVSVVEKTVSSIDANTKLGFTADAAQIYVDKTLKTGIKKFEKASKFIDLEKVPHAEGLRKWNDRVGKLGKVVNGINVAKTAYDEYNEYEKAKGELNNTIDGVIERLGKYIRMLEGKMTCEKSNKAAVSDAMREVLQDAVEDLYDLEDESLGDRKVLAGIGVAGSAAAFIPEPPGVGTAVGLLTGMVKESETKWRDFLDEKTLAQITMKYESLIYDEFRAYDPTPCEEEKHEEDFKGTTTFTWADEVWPPCHITFEPKIIIDPSGKVYEAMLSNPLEGVTVTIEYLDGSTWKEWDDAPLYNDQQKSYVTNASGFYKWDVPDGTWRVKYYKEGYNGDQAVYSAEMPVPPVWLDVNQNMVNADPASASAIATSTGVAIEFTKPVQAEDVTGAAVTLLKDGEPVEAAVTLGTTENGLVQSVTVELPVDKLSEYTVQVSGVRTYAGTESSFSVAVDTSPLEAVEKVVANLSDGAAVAYGTQLVLTAPTDGSQIYYTTNGVCPRNDAENRVLYTGPITLTESSYYFRIRAFKNGTWSDGLPLHITVNPQGAGSSGDNASLISTGGAVGTDGKRFIDVPEDAWYAEAVDYVADMGYFNGVSEDEFAPDDTMKRGMFAAVLYRLAGEPEFEGTESFSDVPQGRYYTRPIAWAASEGYLLGSNGLFRPEDPVTREQMVAILWRFIGSPKADGSSLNGFSDTAEISAYAKDAMAWAVGNGLIGGKGGGILDPKGSAKRCEVAKVIMLFDKNIDR